MSRGRLVLLCLFVAQSVSSAQLKAVQSGTVVLAAATTSVTDTLSPAVDLTKSFLVFGVSGNDNSPDDFHISGQITNSTTVTFRRLGTTGSVVVHWYVAEFLSGVSVQRGTTQMPGAANPADVNVALSPVLTSQSFPLISFRTNGANFDGGDFVRAKITNSTTLLLAAPDADTSAFVEWQVVEYVGAKVQTGDVSFAAGDASRPASLSPAVVTAKSWLIYTYSDVSGFPDIGRALVRGVISSPSNLTFDRNNTGDGFNLTWYLVEFTDQTTVQHGSEPFATTDLQRNVGLATPINPGSALATGGFYARGGRSNYALDDNPGVGWFTFNLTSSTNLRINRGTTVGNTATADAGWFVVDFLANGCSPLDVVETSTSITVTATADFKLVFDSLAGGSIRELFDIAEDPGETNDLAGSLMGSGNPQGLHNSGMSLGGNFYNAGQHANGRLELLESTPARVRVRQLSAYDDGATVLTGVRGQGDYSVYPSGKIGLRWTRTTTAPVTYMTEYVETFVHKTGAGPLATWVSSSQSSATSPGAGGDHFLLSVNENGGPEPARTDFLHVLHRDWLMANGYGGDADKTNWFYNVGAERENPGWIEETGQVLAADDVERWDLLTYFRPRTLANRTQAAVTERSADYRLPGSLSITRGNPWNDADQNTASDHFNEAEAAYLLEIDQTNGLEFSMVLGATPRFAPFFKARGWRSLQQRPVVRLDGAPLNPGADFQAAVKPVSRAHFAQNVLLHNTLESQGAVDTNPDIGSAGAVVGTNIFQAGRYGNGALFDALGEVITFPSAGNIDFAQGAIELWYRPSYDHDDSARHRLWTYRFDDDHQIFFRKTDINQLQLQIRTGPNNLTDWVTTNVNSANFSWKAGDWVHLRAVWDDSAAVGNEARIFINGIEPPHSNSGNDYDSSQMTPGGVITIGTDSNGNNPALGIIDEFRIYSTATSPDALAHGGLTSDAREYLASSSQNFVLDLDFVDGSRRGEYLYFGADSEFSGLNIQLATPGEGDAVVAWEFWNGAAWESLGGYGLNDGTSSLTRNGTVYWSNGASSWSVYSIDGGADLFYVRAHVSSGSYVTTPVERYVKTDILLFQYCGDILVNGRVFAFDLPTPTAVDLVAFDATAVDGGVELRWETGAELSNLGFHLYRATSIEGLLARVTPSLIPGLGSSPSGARYTHRDTGTSPGVTYHYWLEDVETNGRTERHGPATATAGSGSGGEAPGTRITYGSPDANRFVVRRTSANHVTVEIWTEGFHAEPNDDGSVRLVVPGFEELENAGVSLPVKRTWIDAQPGRETRLGLVRTSAVETFSSLRLAEGLEPEIVANRRGIVHAERRPARRAFRGEKLLPSQSVRIVSEAFQGESKRVLLELAPLRYDGGRRILSLARYLAVDIVFDGDAPGEEAATEGSRGRTRRTRSRQREGGSVVSRLVTRERGLYAVPLGRRRTTDLRLTRLGREVPFAIRGEVLYFWSGGQEMNPYGDEAVFELELGVAGQRMELASGEPLSGPTAGWLWHTEAREENRMYLPALLDAPDRWFWDMVFSETSKRFVFVTRDLQPFEGGRLSVRLQGGSDLPNVDDHHVRVLLNGNALGAARWDGKRAYLLDVEIPPGTLVEGANQLEVDNLGDAGAAYSMVLLDRFEVRYARAARLAGGVLEGELDRAATVAVSGATGTGAVMIVDVTDEPRWLQGFSQDSSGVVRFQSIPGRRYVVVNAPFEPESRSVSRGTIDEEREGADLIVIGPGSFLEVASPLLEHRRSQGLRVRGVELEDIFASFGHGEQRPEAVRDYLAFAYHEWREKPRYVLLLGDTTYDFKNYLAAPARNHLPTLMVKTSYLETASDPALASVNGDDPLPDLAIGRLPAGDESELRGMVDKILDYENRPRVRAPVVLVTDDADAAGNFRADADELVRGVLAPFANKALHLEELGTAAMRPAIRSTLDDGAHIVSYMGHGGIELWAHEKIFDTTAVDALVPQAAQPLLLTMNCLNGYFHFPYFDSLAEAMVKAEDKGAIAAFSPSGLSLNGPAHVYHRALLAEILSGGHERLGDAVMEAQKEFLSRDAFPELLSIYHLFGDPTLVLVGE